MADEIKGNGGLGKIDEAVDKLLKLADTASKVDKQKIRIQTDFKQAITETTKLNETLEKTYTNLKGKSHRNDYFVSEEKALVNLSVAWNAYNQHKKNGLDTKKDIGAIVRWGNAYVALGGDINKTTSAMATFYKEQSKQDKFTAAKGYQYTVDALRDLFDVMKQMQSSGYDMSVLSKGLGGTTQSAKVTATSVKRISDEAKIALAELEKLYQKGARVDKKDGQLFDISLNKQEAARFKAFIAEAKKESADVPKHLLEANELIKDSHRAVADKSGAIQREVRGIISAEKQKQAAIKEQQQAKEQLNATATTPPPDTTANTQASSEGIKRESEELKNVSASAEQAAEQKRKFAEANAEVLASITSSSNGLKLEGDGFASLQKLLNRINTLSQDGADGAPPKIDSIIESIKKLRDALNGDIGDNSLLRAIDQLTSRSDALKDLAAVLKSTPRQIKEATNSTSEKKDSKQSNKAQSNKSDEKAFNDALNKTYTEQIKNLEKIIQLKSYNIQHKNDAELETQERIRQNEEAIGRLEAQNAEIEKNRTASSIEGHKRLIKAEEEQQLALLNTAALTDRATRDKYQSDINTLLKNTEDRLSKERLSPQMRQELEAFKATLQSININKPLDELAEDVKNLTDRERELKGEVKDANNIMAKDTNIAQRIRKINDALAKNTKMSANAKAQMQAWVQELSSMNITDARLKEITKDFELLYAEEVAAGRAGLSFFDKMKKSAEGLVRYLGTYVSLYRVIGVIRDGINTVKELDTALVDLRKTTTMTNSQLNEFYYDSNKVAKQLGVTTKEIIQQAANWSRLNKIGLLYGNI